MACCALKKQKKRLIFFPVILFIIIGAFSGIFIVFLSIGGIFSRKAVEKKKKAAGTLNQLLKGLSERILQDPFIFDSSARCKISGKLMNLSTPVAGTIYKYFNLFVLGGMVFFIYLFILGFRVIGN